MGLNIYVYDKKSVDGRGAHIGKRSAHGVWCWDCKEEAKLTNSSFTCFFCGQQREKNDKTLFNPAFRELGFDRSNPSSKKGVDGACSFRWQLGDEDKNLGAKTVQEMKEKITGIKTFITEYGDLLDQKQFEALLSECLVHDYEFSNFS